ncbi:MAG TPA: hypothetical protein VF540_13530 [Segetibacter sp.]|jgi:hypothetical protein
MNHLYDLSLFKTVESLREQIESDYIISENDKPIILKEIEEYFRLKENEAPSIIRAKWAQISKMLDTFDMKVKQ